jgi:hypothetical protein
VTDARIEINPYITLGLSSSLTSSLSISSTPLLHDSSELASFVGLYSSPKTRHHVVQYYIDNDYEGWKKYIFFLRAQPWNEFLQTNQVKMSDSHMFCSSSGTYVLEFSDFLQ